MVREGGKIGDEEDNDEEEEKGKKRHIVSLVCQRFGIIRQSSSLSHTRAREQFISLSHTHTYAYCEH